MAFESKGYDDKLIGNVKALFVLGVPLKNISAMTDIPVGTLQGIKRGVTHSDLPVVSPSPKSIGQWIQLLADEEKPYLSSITRTRVQTVKTVKRVLKPKRGSK